VGVPPTLRYVGLADFPLRSVSAIVENGFPNVRLVRIASNYWTVIDGVVEGEAWPKRRAKYHLKEWLEWLGCEDATRRDPSEFVI
jgi:hypothetical protein